MRDVWWRSVADRFRGNAGRFRRFPKCPRQDSNLRTRFRKPLLSPLSYEGITEFSSPHCSFQHNVSTTFWESPLTTLDPSHYSSMWTVVGKNSRFASELNFWKKRDYLHSELIAKLHPACNLVTQQKNSTLCVELSQFVSLLHVRKIVG